MEPSRIARMVSLPALVLAAAVWGAPSAAAVVTDLEVLPGLSVGAASPFGAGCTYLVVAETSDSVGTPSDKGVGIVDYNRASSFPLQEFAWDHISPYWQNPVIFDHAFMLWTPTAPGEHALMAYQTSAGGPVEKVMVNPALPLGPLCFVAP
ncbi:hypothetical protein [Prescottella equi]|jgi:hypothetical protein|nr:hypothetical protein [Prescottella equi]UNQ35495.1 hypothetical protein MPC39_02420 [Prescottella equi]BDE57458.1 hypothetical protein REA19_04740 [Prescottella equi]